MAEHADTFFAGITQAESSAGIPLECGSVPGGGWEPSDTNFLNFLHFLAMGIPWINHAEFFRKLAGTSAESDDPARGNSLAAHGNAMGARFTNRIRPARAP
jgi:hypothetical protein